MEVRLKAEGPLAKGQNVRVYPHGNPDQAADGTVMLISGNQRSIAVAFGDFPPFAFRGGAQVAIHVEFGAMLFATREELDGVPWGPWVELGFGDHYEIEAIENGSGE